MMGPGHSPSTAGACAVAGCVGGKPCFRALVATSSYRGLCVPDMAWRTITGLELQTVASRAAQSRPPTLASDLHSHCCISTGSMDRGNGIFHVFWLLFFFFCGNLAWTTSAIRHMHQRGLQHA